MQQYRAFGVTIASTVDLRNLNAVDHGDADAALTVEAAGASPGTVSHWLHQWRLGRDLSRVSFGRTTDGYLVRFDGVTDFMVSHTGTLVRCPDPAAHAGVPIEHLLLDQVVPLALARQGHLLLHASAVHVPGFGAIAILGRSRRGKSTLAAAFARHAEIIADDCLRIDAASGSFHAVPSYPELRLWSDAGAKLRFDADVFRFKAGDSPLRAIFVLGARSTRGPAAVVCPVPAARAFVQVARHQFQLDVADRRDLARSFHTLTALVATVPVYRLRVRDNLDAVGDAADGVVRHLLAS
jgi:hypothetical protein